MFFIEYATLASSRGRGPRSKKSPQEVKSLGREPRKGCSRKTRKKEEPQEIAEKPLRESKTENAINTENLLRRAGEGRHWEKRENCNRPKL